MAWIDDEVSAQFARWEERGRGWRIWPQSVELEPPFVPFNGYAPNVGQFIDDGKRPNPIISALTKIGLLTAPPSPPAMLVDEPEPEPQAFARSNLVELQLSLPKKVTGKLTDMAPMLRQLGLCNEPIAFEVLGTHEHITVQFAVAESDAPTIRRQLKAHFPEVLISETNDALASVWSDAEEAEHLVVEFGLAREFAFPLARLTTDPFTGLMGAMEELALGEVCLFQVLFQPVAHPWADHLLQAVTDTAGKPLFQNAPELTQLAQEKTISPLFATVIRMAIKAEGFDRILGLARDLAGSLRLFSRIDGNELIPLRNDEYPFEAHLKDVVLRQSRRSGVLLNAEELIGFVHVPTVDVQSAKLQKNILKTKAAPLNSTGTHGLFLGLNTHAGKTYEVSISPEARSRHMHVIGASGSGKSTLLCNLIRQDIESGAGMALLDPHGDLVDTVLGMIPPHRIDDVVLFDPSDPTHAVGFNILSAHSELEKTLLASDLVSVFQRLSTSWGDQMNSVLQNAIMAFLESSEGGTLLELRRFLIEPDFRKRFLQTVADSEVLYYWQQGFKHLTGSKSIGPILTRLDGFLARKPIRHMVCQRENRLDFAAIMDTRKIFLAKLSQGTMGRENAFLLGSLLVGKFQETAMSRQAQAADSRVAYSLVVDEFPHFITPSMADILTGTRKYGLSLFLAHQELRQLEREREVASAVFGAHTRICFRLADEDARKLAEGFSSFEASDLQNLNTGQAICRLERPDRDFNLAVPSPPQTDPGIAAEKRHHVITRSREKYSRLRSEVETELQQRLTIASETAPEKTVVQTPKPKGEPPTNVPAESPKPPTPASAAPAPPQPAPKPQPSQPKVIEIIPKAPVTPSTPGRGGPEHKALQRLIKDSANALGFTTRVEQSILDGEGSIDVLIERDSTSIACEIALTTPVESEVNNIGQRLVAGVSLVAVLSPNQGHLDKIKVAVKKTLPAHLASRVEFFLPDTFLAFLRNLKPTTPKFPKNEKISQGYKVKLSAPELTTDEQKAKEEAAIRNIAEAMRRKQKPQ
jgi:hypothetical protein